VIEQPELESSGAAVPAPLPALPAVALVPLVDVLAPPWPEKCSPALEEPPALMPPLWV
jgi:hypothetical protein